jgi:hypothetical protein
VTTEAELSAGPGSVAALVAEAVLVISPSRSGRTVIFRETTALLARLGQVAKTVPVLLLADPPVLGTAETKAAPAGKGSVISRPVVAVGPRLVTDTV